MGLTFVLHLILLFSFPVISDREAENVHLGENVDTEAQYIYISESSRRQKNTIFDIFPQYC